MATRVYDTVPRIHGTNGERAADVRRRRRPQLRLRHRRPRGSRSSTREARNRRTGRKNVVQLSPAQESELTRDWLKSIGCLLLGSRCFFDSLEAVAAVTID